jgi:hypothetical protein
MKDMTKAQARVEAVRRWGASGSIEFRPSRVPRAQRGRLARYACRVGDRAVGCGGSIEGQGDTWREAFDDAQPR